MTESTPWRRLWEEIDHALGVFDDSLTRDMERFLKTIRTAIEEYGRDVDPDAFNEYGLPREAEAG